MTVTPLSTSADRSSRVLLQPCVLLKLGEVVLKGRNRRRFESMLQNNIRCALGETGIKVRLWQRDGVVVLFPVAEADAAETEADAIAARMLTMMGVARVCRAVAVPKDPENVLDVAVGLAAGRTGSFAVRAKRRDRRFPMTSSDIEIEVGARVQQALGNPVNLGRPDFTIHIEVDQGEVFVYTDAMAGQGGLPVGMSGRALVLMSGGIDSPVAAYRMMRRGLNCSFLHFSGMPLTGAESIYKAYGLVRQLGRFQRGPRLYVVPFGRAQRRLAGAGAGRLQILAQRRLMLKTAQELARHVRAQALVTGDSLGQVASQTLANLTAVDDAADLPVLRPLIGLDKTEIMAEARRIGTLKISELPDTDCCSLLVPRQVETRARAISLRRIDDRIEADGLAVELAASAREYRPGPAVT